MGPTSKSCLWPITAGKRSSGEAPSAGTCRSGHLVYINNGTLFAVPFDLDTLGGARHARAGAGGGRLLPWKRLRAVRFLAKRNAGVPERRSGGGRLFTVQWLDGAGKTQPLLAKPGPYVTPRLSPDGQRLALMVTEGSNSDIWIYEWQRDTMTRLTFGGGSNIRPVWSPDGRYIVFRGPGGMFWTRSDGAGKPQPLTQSKNRQVPFSFTPDGKRLAFLEQASDGV